MNANKRAPSRRHHTRAFLVIAAAACLVGLTAAPAAAEKPFENVHDRFTVSFEDNLCGIDVEGTVTSKEHFKGRIGPNGFPMFQGNVKALITWFNPETGRTVTERDISNFRDISVTDNGDGTITVVQQITGIPLELTLDDGTVALKDVGRIVFSTVIDYNGTPTDTEDDEFVSQEILSISGPHPEAESDFTLSCSAFVEGLT